jgi:WD40 repeat protein
MSSQTPPTTMRGNQGLAVMRWVLCCRKWGLFEKATPNYIVRNAICGYDANWATVRRSLRKEVDLPMDAKHPQRPHWFGRLCTRRNAVRLLAVLLFFAIFLGVYYVTPIVPRATFHHEDACFIETFSPDGKTLVTTEQGHNKTTEVPFHVWDLQTGQQRFTARKVPGWIMDCRFSPDGRFLSSHQTKGLTVWNAATGEEIAVFPEWPQPGDQPGIFARGSPDGRFVLHQRDEKTIVLWEVETQQVRATIEGKLQQARFDRNGKRMALLENDASARTWNVAVWAIGENGQDAKLRTEHRLVADVIAISPNFAYIATACKTDPINGGGRDIELREIDSGLVIARRTAAPVGFLPGGIEFSPNGQLLLCWPGAELPRSPDRLGVFDVNSGLKELAIYHPTPEVSRDGRLMLVLDYNNPGGFGVMELSTLQQRLQLLRPHEIVNSSFSGQFAPDNKTIVVWRIASWRGPDPITSLYYQNFTTSKGVKIVTDARMWDLETCKELADFEDCHFAVYSADSKLLATAHEDGTVRIWDVPPRKPLVAILGVSFGLWALVILAITLVGRLARCSGTPRMPRLIAGHEFAETTQKGWGP